MTEAGYDLDMDVLTRVMGGSVEHNEASNRCWVSYRGELYPDASTVVGAFDCARSNLAFSRDDAAAMAVVDEMVMGGLLASIDSLADRRWYVAFYTPTGGHQSAVHSDRRVAICLAALRAVAGTEEATGD